VPSFLGVIRSTKLTNSANDLFASLTLARSEAAKRHDRVALCKSADGKSCVLTGGWEQGWIVFHDVNNNGVRETSESLIGREATFASSLRLTGNLNVSRYVSFAPSGSTKLIGGGFQAGTLTVCNQSADTQDARQIVLNAVGRPRVTRTTVGYCS